MSILIDTIRASVIGAGVPITTSFGEKPLIYADYTASGRALTFIEDYIRDQVLPFYACLLYTSPSPRDLSTSRMPSSA